MFDPSFFISNRERLLKELGTSSLVVLTAFTQMQRGNDYAYPFQQESNFWYLTGIEEPDWQLIIDGMGKTWLVEPDVDKVRQVFDGSLAREQATKISGIKDIVDPIEAKRLLGRLQQNHAVVHSLSPQAMQAHYGFHPNPAHKQLMESLGKFQVQDCRADIARLRAIKQPVELDAMQSAIDITTEGIKHALGRLKAMKYEYEFEAEVTYYLRRQGIRHAYEPIVAAGANSCTMHHEENNGMLNKKDVLLFDIGAKVNNYCADISRTIPIASKFTKRQLAVYEAVMRVHKNMTKLYKAGQPVKEFQAEADDMIGKELRKLKLIKTDDWDDIRRFFPHAIGHGLGLDPHDPLGKPVVFAENMVVTLEPGIYIPNEGFGIRIEDDILITADGPKVMSTKLPTDLAALEKLIK